MKIIKTRHILLVLLFAVLSLALTNSLTGLFIDLFAPPLKVDNSPAPAKIFFDDIARNNEIKFAVAPVWSHEKTIQDYQIFVEYLSQELKVPVSLVLRRTYGEIIDLIRDGVVQMAYICTGTYLNALEEGVGLAAVSVPLYASGVTYRSVIVVRSDSQISTAKDFKDKIFAFTDPRSLSGYYYAQYYFIQNQMDVGATFARTVFTNSHEASFNALVDGVVDGISIHEKVYEEELSIRPELIHSIKILNKSPSFGINPFVVSTSLDSELVKNFKKVLENMHKDAQGTKILNRLGFVKFDQFRPELYTGAAETIGFVKNTKNKKD